MVLISTLVFMGLLIFWYLRSQSGRRGHAQATKTEIRQRQNRASRYHAVSIHPRSGSCMAAESLHGQRFLPREGVPNLPLADCTSAQCTCRYVHHEDRRGAQGNRRAAYSMQTEFYGLDDTTVDRRAKRGRRATDAGAGAMEIDYSEIQWTS